jgi:vacuolar-type H+-ATPase subunit C/Vma6
MIRRKSLLLEREGLSDVLLDTGTLAPAFFERIYDTGWESFAAAVKPTEYGSMVTNALSYVDQSNFLSMVDFWCLRDMLEFLRRTKQICFGIEPVLAYYLARDHELRVVRAIWTGKRFHYPQERLKSRMKELY